MFLRKERPANTTLRSRRQPQTQNSTPGDKMSESITAARGAAFTRRVWPRGGMKGAVVGLRPQPVRPLKAGAKNYVRRTDLSARHLKPASRACLSQQAAGKHNVEDSPPSTNTTPKLHHRRLAEGRQRQADRIWLAKATDSAERYSKPPKLLAKRRG